MSRLQNLSFTEKYYRFTLFPRGYQMRELKHSLNSAER